MNFSEVAKQLAAHLDAVPGWQSGYIGPPGDLTDPAYVVPLPDAVEYDLVYQRGQDSVEWTILVVLGRVDDRDLLARTTQYLDGAGERSIKAALESKAIPYTACGDVHVTGAEVVTVSWRGTDFQGIEFRTVIMGSGS